MKTKKQYIAPALKCVEFKVERGYNLSQGTDIILGGNTEFKTYVENPGSFHENRFGGYFSDNTEEWD